MIYLFENCSLDADRRELRRGANLVAIEPQVFDLLLYLIRHRERVVSKDDLIAAVWGGRIVSESTISSRIAVVRQAVGDSGEEQRLIRTVTRKGLRFVGEVREEIGASAANPAVELLAASGLHAAGAPMPSEIPSIAILPFANFSGDPEQECLVEGITEDITTALSQFRWLRVIARGASLTYKSRAIDGNQIGRELGVRYVLQGSVRKAENRVRITTQLIDAATQTNLWANRFSRELEDIFDLQDHIAASVVGAIAPKLEQTEIERAKRKSAESLDPYDCYVRGMGSVYQWTKGGISEALRFFQRATEINPEFASAYGMAAYCYVQRKSYGWLTDRSQEVAEAAQLARRAAEVGKDDAIALSKAAHAISSVVGDVDSGMSFIDQALLLNPNLPVAWYVSGWLKIFLGEPELAVDHLARAVQLSPFDLLVFKTHTASAYAHFFAGRYDDASASAERVLAARPNYLTAVRGAAASHALAGRVDRAQKWIAHMRGLDPALRISNLRDLLPLRRAQDFSRWVDGLHRAGLPE